MLLMIDNYDSFTYNLYQYLSELGAEVVTVRNDKITLEDIEEMAPEGPELPTLGVCLGHQCIGYVYGARVDRAAEIRHGKTSMIHHSGKGLLSGLPDPFEAIRYHSLVVYPETLPDSLEVTAWTDDGLIMGLRHKEHPVEGVQFHPESIMTPQGKALLQNFLDRVKG